MSKRQHTRVNLADYKERKADEGSIDVDLPDGTTFRIPPPELWPDLVTLRIQAEQASPSDAPYTHEQMARDIVGTEEFDHFVAQGGTATLFHMLLKEEHGLEPGESSASSSSSSDTPEPSRPTSSGTTKSISRGTSEHVA